MGLLTVIVCLAALHQAVGQALGVGFSNLSRLNVNNQNMIVNKHNDLRRGVKPTARNMLKMVWNPEAANNAQRWADQCKMSISPRNERVINGPAPKPVEVNGTLSIVFTGVGSGVSCGENILQATYPLPWSDAIQQWYNQVANFKFGTGAIRDNAPIAGYTQVVWYRSYQIGCGVAYCPQNKFQYFYVCQYCPAGNDVEDISKPYKQGPSCGDCPNACDQGLCTNPCKHVDKYANCATLKELFSCDHSMVKENCPASCRCTTEIK